MTPEPVSPLRAGLLCRCPRCGEGKLYSGVLTVRERCAVCGLDLRAQDAGDGPAVFVIFALGFIVMGMVAFVELKYEPPLWVHAAIWPLLTVAGAVALLRPLKAGLIALQYRHRASGGERL
jgi:uncharacterized protein (DUF983 family)